MRDTKNRLFSVSCKECAHFKKSIFCNLPECELLNLDRLKTVSRYQKKQVIFYENAPPQGIYCIQKGVVKLYNHPASQEKYLITILTEGETIGQYSLLPNEPFFATCEALENTVVCFLDKNNFYDLLTKYPTTAFHLLEHMAEELHQTRVRIADFVNKNVSQRVGTLFLELNEKCGIPTERGSRLRITLSQVEMADLAGTSRESICRVLSDFKRNGLIQIENNITLLLDLKKIQEAAGYHMTALG